jgi:hypothetical protein
MKKFDLVSSNSGWNDDLKNNIYTNTLNLFSKIDYIKSIVNNPIGLMVGKIQSGKTGNLIGAAAHAFDNGYKLVIMYLSDQYALYEQNMLRVKKSFETTDNSIIFIDNSKQNNDLSMYERSIGDIDFHLEKGRCFVVCTLKHSKRINKISEVFSQSKITQSKVLIIDDEGDDISQNTNKLKHKKLKDDTIFTPNNKAIVNLMSKFQDYVYISVTATPQAQLLIYKFEELSPNFCSLIYPGNGYVGLNTFHSGDEPLLIETINDYKKLTDEKTGIPRSLKKALVFFALSGYLRKTIEFSIDPMFKHSFLIHVDKLIIKQNEVYDRFQTYIDRLISDLKLLKTFKSSEIKLFESLLNEIISEETNRLNLVKESGKEDLLLSCLNILSEVKIILLNGQQEVNNLKKTIFGRNFFIVIGGDMLDRGLTIDGLAVSYFTRESKKSQADTLLQRARWFGYKEKYINFCKLYTTDHIVSQFEAALEHENSVWDFLEVYENTKSDLRNVETRFKLDTDLLSPTSSAKARWKTEGIERWFVQNYFSKNPSHQQDNKTLIDNFIGKNSSLVTFKSNFNNLTKTTSFDELFGFVSKFKFSELQKKNLQEYLLLLKRAYVDFEKIDFDVVYLRFELGEERKVISTPDTDYLSNIMQGRNKNIDQYPGDREIIQKNPMLQIHKVILKSDSGLYKKGDVVYTLAFGLPLDFIVQNLIFSDMELQK